MNKILSHSYISKYDTAPQPSSMAVQHQTIYWKKRNECSPEMAAPFEKSPPPMPKTARNHSNNNILSHELGK